VQRKFKATHDADGAIDYGNIDVFEIKPAGQYYLEGDWGRVMVRAESVSTDVVVAS
jgi:hypothetical protein